MKLVLNPHEFWEDVRREKPIISVKWYALVVFFSLIIGDSQYFAQTNILLTIFVNFVLVLLALFLITTLVHVFIHTKVYGQTLKIFAYSSIPAILVVTLFDYIITIMRSEIITLILFLILILVLVYTLVMEIVGLKIIQKISTIRAYVAVIIATFLVIFIRVKLGGSI